MWENPNSRICPRVYTVHQSEILGICRVDTLCPVTHCAAKNHTLLQQKFDTDSGVMFIELISHSEPSWPSSSRVA